MYDFIFIEFRGDQRNVYQELAEKDHYLMLAAEAGKVLLEKNQELSEQYSRLQEEYLQKIEVCVLSFSCHFIGNLFFSIIYTLRNRLLKRSISSFM